LISCTHNFEFSLLFVFTNLQTSILNQAATMDEVKTPTDTFIPPAYDPNYRHPWLDHYREEAVRAAREEEEARLRQEAEDEARRLREEEQARLLAQEIQDRIQERAWEEQREAEKEAVRLEIRERKAVRDRTKHIIDWTAFHIHAHGVYPSDSDELEGYNEV
jgi:hypothetical protein